MATQRTLPEATGVDSAPIRWAPWLTPRHLTLFVIGWLMLFSVIGVFVSNPFQSETSASASPDYAKVMFLHGLLIGMVGLLALLVCQVLALRSMHVRMLVTGGVVVATILSALGGIWDDKIPGAEVAMWTQILSFFALDEILAVLIYGLVKEWRTARTARTLPYIAAVLGAGSMLAAALMGHVAGWIMEFGNMPTLLGDYARFAGIGTVDDFAGALVGSHSHEMAVGVMAMTVIIAAQQLGYPTLTGAARVVSRVGMAVIAVGIIAMTAMYVASALSTWAPPTWFVSGPQDANGIASDDIISGILVMGGGVLALAALLFGKTSLFRQPTRLAAIWSWVLSFATVVIAGYAIEMNEAHFGAGDPKAAGAANDAIFTWLHQDIGLFLLPAIVLVMLAAERLIDHRSPGFIGWTTIVGTTIAFVGGMVYVFVDPAIYGVGYAISTIGLLVIGIALLATLWYGVLNAARPAEPAKLPESPLARTAPLWPPRPAEPAAPEREKVPTA